MATPGTRRILQLTARAAWAPLVILACYSASGGEIARTDKTGRLQALVVEGAGVPLFSDIIVPSAGWKRIPGLGDAKDVKSSKGPGGARRWTGRIEPEGGKPFLVEQTLSEGRGAATLDIEVTAEADTPTVGVILKLGFPIEVFAGGECVLEGLA